MLKKLNIKEIYGKTVSSVAGGYEAFLLEGLQNSSDRDILYLVADGLRLEQTKEILNYINPNIEVLTLPAWDTVPYDRVSPNAYIMAERINVLSQLNTPRAKPRIIIASTSSALQLLPPAEIFIKQSLQVVVGNKLNLNGFIKSCVEGGYTRVEQVIEPGEYALRGDIIDIFPTGSAEPLRIDLFDDEVERLRTFDPLSQRSTGELKSYVFQNAGEVILTPESIGTFRSKYRELFGAAALKDEIYESLSSGQKYVGMENWLPLFYEQKLVSIFDYLPGAHIIIGRDVFAAAKSKEESIKDYYQARLDALKTKEEIAYRPIPPELLYLKAASLSKAGAVRFSALQDGDIDLEITPGKEFFHAKNISRSQVYDDLKAYLEENKKLNRIICCSSEGSVDRLHTLLTEHGISSTICQNWSEAQSAKNTALIILDLNRGFKGQGLCLIAESDILGEKKDRKPPKKVTSKDFIADVSSLAVGELVVHIEHGIGRFLGLENITAGGSPHDCLKILYAGDDKLFVPVENIELISRYGLDNENVQLDTLGSASWSLKKEKVKKRIKDIAEKLIKIAAERELKTGELFIPPEGSYDEFCSHFPYNETDDQLNAINDVVADLNKGIPMDRLICGDVGFGKTEVALRAAFTVAMSGAQVALIVPTTLLARQHYHNFKKRMEGFPIRVKMLSRLVTAKESKLTKQSLKDGSVEIIIGTHALLAKDIEFCNLGLLIIDEEQHFGVAHKERLKNLKSDVHVLTLTATPIPRTLQLSLTGVKQLSIIATPPVDRLAARSFVMPYDRVMIKEAIYREKFRGGQTFFVCPRVSDIFGLEKDLKELVPDIKVLVAHGQMPVTKLEDVMTDFTDNKADILLSTTIIESGIDMPAVNTMIIHRADMFGLSQLYQLKGRIGRSKVRGYCYFTVPSGKKLKPLAERRLNILQALDSLGAGFSLASHDMDIRGSGNLLGEEQSGHIKEVGISLYQHMLEEEVMRLKSQGFGKEAAEVEWSPQITTGIPIMIPESYVSDLGVRLGLYKRIGDIKTIEELADMREELIDRFGQIPEALENLLQTVEVKQLCFAANIEKIDAGAKGILIAFKNNTFKNPEKLLEFIGKQFGKIKIRHDQKIFVEQELDSYSLRIQEIKKYVSKLSGLAV